MRPSTGWLLPASAGLTLASSSDRRQDLLPKADTIAARTETLTSHTPKGNCHMTIAWRSARARVMLIALSALWTACQSEVTAPNTNPGANAVLQSAGAATAAASTNGAAGQMPAFYDGALFTVNMKEMPEDASASTIAHNGSINEIYASNDLDDEQDFVPVIDAIQGDGFNPLWRQNLIVFNEGFTPHQFTSDEDVLAAAGGPNPEITLVVTDEVYRCSVVGRK